ncbi:hypothetical protein LJC30_01890 [Odoribacter sp. OttesenSCG-928-L07]|nr:hypothetical protein [Odoribacter sp. OttesenSCG-928-L07]MDL2238918.1 hypothetical protein [Bacteroidales bacterium OttesenSCG-928-L14]
MSAQSSGSFNRDKSNTTYSGSSKFEISVSPGFFLGGKMDNFKIGNSANFNLGFSFKLPTRNADVELSYTGAFPKGTLIHHNNHIDNNLNMSSYVSFIQIGYRNYLLTGNFKPYWLFTVGAFNINSKLVDTPILLENPDDYNINQWMFAAALGVGCKYDINDNIALKLQARLLMPMMFTFSGVGINVGSGGIFPSLNINSSTPIMEGDFSLGIVFKL